jgi:hypothetical protein
LSAPPDPRFGRPRTLVFGIGAQKSATSWLDKYLRSHPEVCLPVRKEQHYWSTRRPPAGDARRAWVREKLAKIEARGPLERLTRTARRRAADAAWRLTDVMLRHEAAGHAAYADVLFQRYDGEPVAGEVTPEYALLGAADIAEMAALGRDVRFVFIMRDPVDRLKSGVRQQVRKTLGPEAVTPETVAARLRAALADPDDPAMARSRYDRTIERFERVVPRERMFYLFFETMFRQEEMDRLTDFLGIGRRAAPVERKVHPGVRAEVAFPAALEAEAAAALRPVYDFVRARFGDAVPAAWRPAEAPERPAVASVA